MSNDPVTNEQGDETQPPGKQPHNTEPNEPEAGAVVPTATALASPKSGQVQTGPPAGNDLVGASTTIASATPPPKAPVVVKPAGGSGTGKGFFGKRPRRLWLAVVLIGAPAFGAVAWGVGKATTAERDLSSSLVVTALFLLGYLLLIEKVGGQHTNPERAKYGYLEVIIGTDGYVSTSKTVVWLWTIIFAASLVTLSGMVWFHDLSPDAAFGQNWDEYLLLLGGPFAAAVAAKGITVSRAEGDAAGARSTTAAAGEGVVGASPPSKDGPSPSDVATTNSGATSLPDTQYVVFTFVAVLYFVGAFIHQLINYAKNACPPLPPGTTGSGPAGCLSTLALPGIPAALLGLTSLAALTYVGAKTVEKEGLRLSSLTPNPVAVSQPVAFVLVNARETDTITTTTVRFTPEGDGKTPIIRSPLEMPAPVHDGLLMTFSAQAPSAAGIYGVVIVTSHGCTSSTPLKVE